jgi:hypothetical protein
MLASQAILDLFWWDSVGYFNHLVTYDPEAKEVQDTAVFKQGAGICLLGRRRNFAVYYMEKGSTIKAKYYVALFDKLKQQLVSKHRGKF